MGKQTYQGGVGCFSDETCWMGRPAGGRKREWEKDAGDFGIGTLTGGLLQQLCRPFGVGEDSVCLARASAGFGSREGRLRPRALPQEPGWVRGDSHAGKFAALRGVGDEDSSRSGASPAQGGSRFRFPHSRPAGNLSPLYKMPLIQGKPSLQTKPAQRAIFE